jgi:ergothioneine biosynthesis protein EgtB
MTAFLPGVSPSIDSPDMRRAGHDLLSLALMDARNHTLHLLTQFEAVAGGANRAGAMPAVSQALWLAGHAGWFAEAWIGRNPQRGLGSACPGRPLRLASIEPMADAWWELADPVGGHPVSVPGFSATRAYLLASLESTLELLEKTAGDDEALYFYRLALFHEDLCGERLVMLAQTQRVPLGLAWPAPMAVREPLGLPATRWSLGSEPGGFVFDNERQAHAVAVPAFEIDAQPVTWAQYAEFVDDGGYDRAELWHPEGWAWVQAPDGGRRGPRHVEQIGVARWGGGGSVIQTRFGQPARVAGSQPASHVSWWEADAWCRWAGRRLPDEVEWELAAQTAVRRGFRWGEVHEWTATVFRPYPGFVPGPWANGAQANFDRAKAVRGASWATRARMKHPKFRGFHLPGTDEAFTGFRSCAL